MITIDLAKFKKHVRTDDFETDDEYLAFLAESAKDAVLVMINRTEAEVEQIIAENATHPSGFSEQTLQLAIMQLAAHWYNNRESVGPGQLTEMPHTLQLLEFDSFFSKNILTNCCTVRFLFVSLCVDIRR